MDIRHTTVDVQYNNMRDTMDRYNHVRITGGRYMNYRYDYKYILDDLMAGRGGEEGRDRREEGERLGMHGCVVITNSKDQSVEVYRSMRLADSGGVLNIRRLGSVSYLSPHVEYMKDMAKMDRDELEDVSISNLAQSANWNSTDVLVCTVGQLVNMIDDETVGMDINPKYIIMEDCELMMTNEENMKMVRKLLRLFLGKYRSSKSQDNKNRKFILSTKIPLIEKQGKTEPLEQTKKDSPPTPIDIESLISQWFPLIQHYTLTDSIYEKIISEHISITRLPANPPLHTLRDIQHNTIVLSHTKPIEDHKQSILRSMPIYYTHTIYEYNDSMYNNDIHTMTAESNVMCMIYNASVWRFIRVHNVHNVIVISNEGAPFDGRTLEYIISTFFDTHSSSHLNIYIV